LRGGEAGLADEFDEIVTKFQDWERTFKSTYVNPRKDAYSRFLRYIGFAPDPTTTYTQSFRSGRSLSQKQLTAVEAAASAKRIEEQLDSVLAQEGRIEGMDKEDVMCAKDAARKLYEYFRKTYSEAERNKG
jgi:hypothetical protein